MKAGETGAVALKIIKTTVKIGRQITKNEKTKPKSLCQHSLRLRSEFIEHPL
jgi:hypothetical protein